MEASEAGAVGHSRMVLWWMQRRFFTMIAITIVVSMVLVIVAMSLYNSSGAAQLDLSRPGYQAVRKDVVQDKDAVAYPSTGELDQAAIDQFNKMYSTRAKSVSGASSFDPGAMSDDALQLFHGQTDAQTP